MSFVIMNGTDALVPSTVAASPVGSGRPASASSMIALPSSIRLFGSGEARSSGVSRGLSGLSIEGSTAGGELARDGAASASWPNRVSAGAAPCGTEAAGAADAGCRSGLAPPSPSAPSRPRAISGRPVNTSAPASRRTSLGLSVPVSANSPPASPVPPATACAPTSPASPAILRAVLIVSAPPSIIFEIRPARPNEIPSNTPIGMPRFMPRSAARLMNSGSFIAASTCAGSLMSTCASRIVSRIVEEYSIAKEAKPVPATRPTGLRPPMPAAKPTASMAVEAGRLSPTMVASVRGLVRMASAVDPQPPALAISCWPCWTSFEAGYLATSASSRAMACAASSGEIRPACSRRTLPLCCRRLKPRAMPRPKSRTPPIRPGSD